MDNLIRKKALVLPESAYGVCLWKLDENSKLGAGFISDGPNNFLCAEGRIGDKAVEERMRQEVIKLIGEENGEPHWVAGSRKITDSEYDDQIERLESGLIPDWEEARRLRERGEA